MSRTVFITYEEATRLKPVFRRLAKEAPWKEARESARQILGELEYVKDVDYKPLPGSQLFLDKDIDMEFLLDVMNQLELR